MFNLPPHLQPPQPLPVRAAGDLGVYLAWVALVAVFGVIIVSLPLVAYGFLHAGPASFFIMFFVVFAALPMMFVQMVVGSPVFLIARYTFAKHIRTPAERRLAAYATIPLGLVSGPLGFVAIGGGSFNRTLTETALDAWPIGLLPCVSAVLSGRFAAKSTFGSDD